jgi:multimeric flavodoxin WrbA
MKEILGVIGSPRKMGNSEIIIKEIGRQITEPHELKLLRLSDFNIGACRGCYSCLAKKEQCVLGDDLYTIVDAICEADGIILAAPTYFLGANAVLKRFVDRSFSLYARNEQLFGTPSIGISIAGVPGKEGHCLLDVEKFLKMIFSDIKASQVLYAALPGEAVLSEANIQTAKELAEALFKPAPASAAQRCPVCGGDTFRLLGNNEIKCMLCSNLGTLDMSSGNPTIHISRSEHEMFLTRTDLIKHKDWLIGMKSRFMEKKDDLRAVSMDYREAGTWIKP